MAKRIKKVYYGSYLPVRRSGTKPFLLRFFPYDKSPIPKSVRQDWSGWYERKYKTKSQLDKAIAKLRLKGYKKKK